MQLQLETSGCIIAMLMPIIGEHFNSLKTLRALSMCSKAIHMSVHGNADIVRETTKKMSVMSTKDVRKLFMLPATTFIPLALGQPLPSYPWERVPHRYSAFDAFQIAMVAHGGITKFPRVFANRQVRSTAMKLAWAVKNERIEDDRLRRIDEVSTIKLSLSIVNGGRFTRTHSPIWYEIFGTVEPMNQNYCDQKLMTIHKKPSGPDEDDVKFKELVRRDMFERDKLSHEEKLSILAYNIGYEHWFSHYTTARELLASTDRFNIQIRSVAFLFPLPEIWPWVSNVPIRNIGEFSYYDIPALYLQWRTDHDALYEDRPAPPVVQG